MEINGDLLRFGEINEKSFYSKKTSEAEKI
jgi:hypothetical protein